jgi:hypothetical protein
MFGLHLGSSKLITPLMCFRPDPLKIFGLCWLVQFIPKDGKQNAKTETELCDRIKKKLKEIDVSIVQTMMRGVRIKLR